MARPATNPQKARHHTVVLGRNRQLAPLLRQMAVAQRERGTFPGEAYGGAAVRPRLAAATHSHRRSLAMHHQAATFPRLFCAVSLHMHISPACDPGAGPVVVLAEGEKADLDRELSEALAGACARLDVAARGGPPSSPLHLDRVRAAEADVVLVLAPGDGTAGGGGGGGGSTAVQRQVAALLALQALRAALPGSPHARRHWQSVVLQCPSDAAAGGGGHALLDTARQLLVRAHARVELCDISAAAGLASAMAASAAQPGVAAVVASLVQQTGTGAELYLAPCPEAGAGLCAATALPQMLLLIFPCCSIAASAAALEAMEAASAEHPPPALRPPPAPSSLA